jgi:phage tail-like protein
VKIKREAIFEGGVNDQQRILIGQAEFADVTLKRGMTDNLVFWEWLSQVLGQSSNQRRNINILLFNQAGETMQCWTLIGAIPIGWKAPALHALLRVVNPKILKSQLLLHKIVDQNLVS